MSFSPITLTALACAEKILNKALSLDETSGVKLDALSGQSLTVCTSDVNLCFYIVVSNRYVHLLSHREGETDATLRGSAAALLKVLTAADKTVAMLSSDVEIIGNTDTTQKMQILFTNLNIDWEAYIGNISGSTIMAHELAGGVKSLTAWFKNTALHFRQDVREYLDEEAPFKTPRGKMDAYLNELDNIKLRMDRLDAQLTRLQEQFGKL